MSCSNTKRSASLRLGASAVAMLAVIGSNAALAQAQTQELETVVVTGFRQSLEKAMDLKRTNVEATDSILAEDIGKFPDMNVSESLQRIPGVNITRDGGEGRQIAVRGLGAQFTRVRINGMETIATVGGPDVSTSGGGANRGRGFDFNVFASDLFSALTVHKSNSADMEEGSLGATVDLTTGRPFDYSGPVLTASVQYGYQDMNGSSNPRVALLASHTFLGGRLGFLVSGAYGITNTREEGVSTVRWMNDTNTSTTGSVSSSYQFAAVCTDAGVTCATSASDPNFAAANAAFHPRFPRYEIYKTNEKRLGLTGAMQWQPDDKTLFTLNGLFADFAQVRQEFQLEGNSLSTSSYGSGGSYVDSSTGQTMYYRSLGMKNITLINFSSSNIGGPTGIEAVGNDPTPLQRLQAPRVGLRTEQRLAPNPTRFMQVTLDGSHEFSEKFKVHMLAGWSESHYRNPIQTYLMADYGCLGTTNVTNGIGCGAGTDSSPYIYDFSQGNIPELSLGNVDPTSTAGWFLSTIRKRENYVNNSFRTINLDGAYQVTDALKLSGGGSARFFGYNTLEKRRGVDTSTSESNTIPDSVRSVPLSNYASTIGFEGVNAPAGSQTNWFTLDFNKAASAISIWDPSVYPMSFAPGYSNTGAVRESDYSGWVQADWDTRIADMGFRGNVGVRYVQTDMTSLGYSLVNGAITPATGHNVYHDWLPSLNAVLEPFDSFLVRFNAAYAMARPGLGAMMPTGKIAVSGSNASASIGNPKLQPTRSKNLDLAFEYYYGRGSMISLAGFWKHIDTFNQSVQSTGTAAQNPFGLETAAFVSACGGTGSDWATITNSYCISNGGQNMDWTYTATTNAKGAPLYGTEINWQQQFDFLPGRWDNTGLLLNYTYVQAQQSYYNSNGTLIMKADLVNLSRNSYNATLYYDDTIFQTRVTAAYRGKYLIDSNLASNNNNYGIWSKSTLNIDASMSYKYDDNFMVFFNAINLTNQGTNLIADRYAGRSYVYRETGRVFYIGVK